MMNNELVEEVATRFAARLKKDSIGDLATAVTLGFRTALGRLPTEMERAKALHYTQGDPEPVKEVAWLLLNLDEFLYVR
jgi:hypothetical protein